jgi:hypothetical protein
MWPLAVGGTFNSWTGVQPRLRLPSNRLRISGSAVYILANLFYVIDLYALKIPLLMQLV